MDPLTHAMLGGVAAKTVGASRRRFWLMMFLGAAPDLDFLANSLGSWAFAFQHRGVTHSFVGLLIQPFFYAWILQRWDQGPFKMRAFHYALPIGLHILCDFLTHYGVPLLAPFSFADFSADLVVGLTFVPIVFMGTGLLWLHRKELHGWVATRPLWVGWAVYLLLSASTKAYAVKLADVSQAKFTMLPTVMNPFSWRAVYLDDATHTYRHVSIDLLKRKRGEPLLLARPNGDFPVQASLQAREVKFFLKNNRWPVVRVTPNEKGWRVEWGNLLFSTQGMIRGKVTVDVASDGAILKQQKTFGFWDPQSN